MSTSPGVEKNAARAVPAVIGKVKQMAQGWWYVIWTDRRIEHLAAQRAAVCGACAHNTGTKCGLCGCPLKAKMRSPASTCPDGRWKR